MLNEILTIILASATNAFLQVGVFVGGMLLIFGLVNYRSSGGLLNVIGRSRRWQPVIGALLGLSPGCGGAILMMPLFVRGVVSYGTVIATLIATAGDSAFVLIAAQPLVAVVAYLPCFVIGIAAGYAVDALGIGRKFVYVEKEYVEAAARHAAVEAAIPEVPTRPGEAGISRQLHHVGHEEGDAIDMALHHRRPARPQAVGRRITHTAFAGYWVLIAVGMALGIMILFQVDIDAVIGIPGIGRVVGIAGTAASIFLMISGHTFLADDTHEEQEHKLYSLRETLVHSAGDTAFTCTWVFVAYVAYELLVMGIGGGDHAGGTARVAAMMQSAGLAAVFVGALIGLIPGCGPQIIFVALFTRGLLPFSALLANAISQDGDALFPLIAMNRRSAFWATIITTIPALIVGLAAYYLGVDSVMAKLIVGR